MGMQILINKKYKRSNKPYDVVTVLDIAVFEGRCSIKCLEVYGQSDGVFYVGAEDTKDWLPM